MANELVGRENMGIISRLLADEKFEFFCLVDSADQIKLLTDFFGERRQRLNVLVELGVNGGRAGIRSQEQLQEVLLALDLSRGTLVLGGVEVYEGILSDEAAIRDYLRRGAQITTELANNKRFERSPVILSGAGSSWYDIVANEFSKVNIGEPIEILLRPGCYLTHDVGIYRQAQMQILKRDAIARGMAPGLIPALQLWAYVQSVPESTRAIIGLGKRDAAFDLGFPVPALHYRPGSGAPTNAPADWKLIKLMDQHAYMEISTGSGLRVGDMIGFDISHPCLTFDKWRYLTVLAEDYRVIDVVETFF